MKITTLTVEPIVTSFLIERRGKLMRRIDAIVRNPDRAGKGRITLAASGGQVMLRADMPKGESRHTLFTPEVATPTRMTARASVDTASASARFTIAPARRWTIYLVMHTHTDIGYTHYQEPVYRMHADFLDEAVRLCRETINYPDEAKFKWVCEASWNIQNYIERREARSVRTLMDWIKRGPIEATALYLQQTELHSHEELVRTLYCAEQLRRQYGLKIEAAINSDVNGFSWGLAMLLARADVKYLNTAINWYRGMMPFGNGVPVPFWWEAPDGSRVLVYNNLHYHFGNELQLDATASIAQVERNVADFLRDQEAKGNPRDYQMIQLSGIRNDNAPPTIGWCDLIRDWNARWAAPRLQTATLGEFMGMVRRRDGRKAEVWRADWQDWWADGNASAAYETALSRSTQMRLLEAEQLAAVNATLGGRDRYPRAQLDAAYRDNTFFDEHTWGFHDSISAPWSLSVRAHWHHKAGFAYRAAMAAEEAREGALAAFVRQVKGQRGRAFVVTNPCSWRRRDLTVVALPSRRPGDPPERFRLIDADTQREVPYRIAARRHDAQLSFVARVPSSGYRTYLAVPGEPKASQATATLRGNVFENRYYRLTLDRKTGGISSIYDKGLRRELLDRRSPYVGNQYIHEMPLAAKGQNGRNIILSKRLPEFSRVSPARSKIVERDIGPVWSSVTLETSGRMAPRLQHRVVLYDDIKRIDIFDTIDKAITTEPEGLYYAFPFAFRKPTVKVEVADAVMEPEVEQLPATSHDWYSMQHFVDVSDDKGGVIWSSVEAPLVQFDEIQTGRWRYHLKIKRGTLFAWIMNNYWTTNFRAWQGGQMTFHFALTSYRGRYSGRRATEFGREAHLPLMTVPKPEGKGGTLPRAGAALFTVEPANVIIAAVKRAEDGRGLIVRLYETGGRSTEAVLTTALGGRDMRAWLTNVVERNQRALAVRGRKVRVPVEAFGLVTVRLKPRR